MHMTMVTVLQPICSLRTGSVPNYPPLSLCYCKTHTHTCILGIQCGVLELFEGTLHVSIKRVNGFTVSIILGVDHTHKALPSPLSLSLSLTDTHTHSHIKILIMEYYVHLHLIGKCIGRGIWCLEDFQISRLQVRKCALIRSTAIFGSTSRHEMHVT